MSTRTINWGVLSTAGIGREKVIPAIQNSPSSKVVAIASRNLERAREVADELGIRDAYGSYEELLADPNVDAIYNPLPNHMHVEFTLAAAKAGKHVLCEKPIAMIAQEAEKLRECPGDICITEAFMVRYHAQWLRVKELAMSGELGDVRAIQSAFSYYNSDAEDIRNKPEYGGGSMMDIGCYPLTAGRFFFDCEPRRVMALIDRDPNFGTDRQASVIADFGEGRQLSFVVSTQLVNHQTISVIGTKARAEILIPFNAPQNETTEILIDDGSSLDAHLAKRETLPASDQYTEQAEAFAQAIINGTPMRYGVDDAIASMRILDAIFESEKSGNWENVQSPD